MPPLVGILPTIHLIHFLVVSYPRPIKLTLSASKKSTKRYKFPNNHPDPSDEPSKSILSVELGDQFLPESLHLVLDISVYLPDHVEIEQIYTLEGHPHVYVRF